MKNKFSLKQITEAGNLDANLKLRQYNVDLMSRIMELESIIPKLRQDQNTKELGCSSSTLQRHRHGRKMESP